MRGKTQVERRKQWNDRRVALRDRRNPERILHSSDDCRSGVPRRQSDITGEQSDGEVWWQSDSL